MKFRAQLDHDRLVSQLSDSEIAIFLFHGVTTDTRVGIRNYTGKHVQLDEFNQLMRKLVRAGCPISIDDAYQFIIGEASAAPGSFVITFDDGFWNNLSLAAPCLADLGIPATFYLTSDFIDKNGQSWVDRIEAAIDSSSSPLIFAPHPLSNTYSITTESEKIHFMKEVRRLVKADSVTDPDAFADALLADFQPPGEATWVGSLDRKLSWAEARELSGDSLFTIGGHGRSHRILGYLSEPEMRDEVTDCLNRITSGIEVKTKHFSYPEGFKGSFNGALVATLQDQGVVTAVTTLAGTIVKGCDPMTLSRVFVA